MQLLRPYVGEGHEGVASPQCIAMGRLRQPTSEVSGYRLVIEVSQLKATYLIAYLLAMCAEGQRIHDWSVYVDFIEDLRRPIAYRCNQTESAVSSARRQAEISWEVWIAAQTASPPHRRNPLRVTVVTVVSTRESIFAKTHAKPSSSSSSLLYKIP